MPVPLSAPLPGKLSTAGLTEFVTRSYDVDARLWVSDDTYRGVAVRASSLNRYAYVEGAPESFVDHLGFFRAAAALEAQRLAAAEAAWLAAKAAAARAVPACSGYGCVMKWQADQAAQRMAAQPLHVGTGSSTPPARSRGCDRRTRSSFRLALVPHALPLVPASAPGSSLTVEQDHGAVIRRSILPGGVRVFTETIPGMRSATLGAWVGVGSRDETPEHAGSTHFLEHLLFKGTARRSALDIAEEFDRVGGESNAMTGKEYTCYYARVIDVDLPMAIDVILDMVTSAAFDPQDFDTERGVILEELAMNDDDPSDVAHERFTEAVLGGHPLGRPIGGTPEIIRAVTRDSMLAHYHEHYVPEGLIITAAGGVDHEQVCQLVTGALVTGGWDLTRDLPPLPRRNADAVAATTLTPRVELTRDIEQAHILIGCEGLKATD